VSAKGGGSSAVLRSLSSVQSTLRQFDRLLNLTKSPFGEAYSWVLSHTLTHSDFRERSLLAGQQGGLFKGPNHIWDGKKTARKRRLDSSNRTASNGARRPGRVANASSQSSLALVRSGRPRGESGLCPDGHRFRAGIGVLTTTEPDPDLATAGELAADVAAAIDELRGAARAAADASRAPGTERAYAADWRDFSAFATRIARRRLPAEPETVALYVADLARRDRKPATIARKLAAVAVFHRSAGHPSPTEHDVVRAVVRGVRRQLGVEQKQKTALELEPLRAVIAQIPSDTRGLRDRALILVGWAAALRRSELAALGARQLRFEEEGVVVWLRRSKTDQEAAGDTVAVPFGADAVTCPVRALRAWLALVGDDGAAFRRVDRHGNIGASLTSSAIATIVRERAEAVGLDGSFAGHSLRAGFATTAARAGRTEAAIMRHGRWKSVQVARRYIRQGSRWIDNPAADLGL
jgi:integrase